MRIPFQNIQAQMKASSQKDVFMSQISTQRIVRLPEVMLRTGLSRSSIYNFLLAGNFPSRIKLGARSIGFLEADINDWISGKIAEASV